MIKLLIFKSDLRTPFEPLKKYCRPWLKRVKQSIGVDQSIFRYIKYYYSDRIQVDLKHPYQVKTFKKYDYIYPGTEYWTIPNVHYYKGNATKFIKLLKQIPKRKLLLPINYMIMGSDKCVQNKLLKKIKIPVVTSKCISTKLKYNDIYSQIRKMKMDAIIIKPIPGEGSHNLFKSKNHNNVFTKEYYTNVKKYNKIIVQKYMKNFASERYPEIRTYWVGNKFVLGVKTTTEGYYKSRVKRLPSVIKYHTQRLINFIEKKYKMKFIFARIDWGYDRSKGYFCNEIEILPGMFVDYYDREFTGTKRCVWNVDKLISERLVEIIS